MTPLYLPAVAAERLHLPGVFQLADDGGKVDGKTLRGRNAGENLMTRNEQPGFDPCLYDEDFYGWTQRQAAALRALPRQPSVDLSLVDVAHLAEEIEDLGRRDLREVLSYLRLVIQHLVKLQAAPGSRDAAHWHTETVNFQLMAREAFSPGMRRLIDVGAIWTGGCRAASRFLKDHGARDPSRDACPFTLDNLLAVDFDVEAATAKIAVTSGAS